MGIGDWIIGSSFARGAAARGERMAFGDGRQIKWSFGADLIFKNNPNVAHPGQERVPGVVWHPFSKGCRQYNRQGNGRWIWNLDFRVKPGELFFDPIEDVHDRDDKLILIEPNVPNKPCGPNKHWPVDRWRSLAQALIGDGWKVRQFEYGRPNRVTHPTSTPTFRHAAAYLKSARLAILPEGGLHHAAAAVGTPAVVLFGGFVPPTVLGYDGHANLTGGATACGSFDRCKHCAEAMDAIKVADVLGAAESLLS